MINNILKNNLWLPLHDKNLSNINVNSWYSLKESKDEKINFKSKQIEFDNTPGELIKAIKIKLHLNQCQKDIIQKWLKATIFMYNETLKYIKQKFIKDKTFKVNYYKIRKKLYNKKRVIHIGSDVNEKNRIKIHDLDYTIKLVCSNYKSAISNFKNKNIKNFRIRYWKYNKKILNMELEKNNFKTGSIRKNVLGQVMEYYNNEIYDFKNIKCDCKLQYNGLSNEYMLYVPIKICKINNNFNSKIISIDPGIRTFLTGLTENKIVKIGDNCQEKINSYLTRIDKISNNDKICFSKRRRLEKKYNLKLNKYIDELQWKSINYLTKNYETILIGDMSTKQIVSNLKKNNLNKKTKRTCYKLKLFVFRERLAYKCRINGNNYKCVNESYTSKICSSCGYEKNDLGTNKIYDCPQCKKKIDRDINGARNIYLKAIK